MSRKEFETIQQDLQKQLWPSHIEVGNNSRADFAVGCYYDDSCGEWVVYKNYERNWHSERLRTKNEEEAFDKLLSIIRCMIDSYQNSLKLQNPE